MTGSVSNNATTVEGVEIGPGDALRAHYMTSTAGEYFQALGITLREGRLLEDADNHRDQKVCLVDQAFANRYWPGQSALGRRICAEPKFDPEKAYTIVGVVGDIKQMELTEKEAQGAVYFPFKGRYTPSSFSIAVRTALEPAALAPMLQRVVLKLDPELPVDELKPMQAWIDESMVSRRSPALLAGIFAGVALLLAAVGTYGVLAYAVSQRRREIGVRMALGALPQQVLAQFLGLGSKLLLAGIALGALGAWGVGRAMQSMLFGVGSVHGGVLAGAAFVMMVVVFVATFLPSHRASRVSPIEALRDD
jgi:predicted permease